MSRRRYEILMASGKSRDGMWRRIAFALCWGLVTLSAQTAQITGRLTDPILPMSPGRAERHGFEYYRHGTLLLYAALDVATGKVHGKAAARHTSEEFVAFLDQVVGQCKPSQEIHIILDNLSAT